MLQRLSTMILIRADRFLSAAPVFHGHEAAMSRVGPAHAPTPAMVIASTPMRANPPMSLERLSLETGADIDSEQLSGQQCRQRRLQPFVTDNVSVFGGPKPASIIWSSIFLTFLAWLRVHAPHSRGGADHSRDSPDGTTSKISLLFMSAQYSKESLLTSLKYSGVRSP